MTLRIITTIAASAALALSLSACASLTGGDAKGAQDLFAKILTDPACAHDDKISVIMGAAGVPASVQASAERHCPVAGAPATPAATPTGR
jgi:hypothetical protein